MSGGKISPYRHGWQGAGLWVLLLGSYAIILLLGGAGNSYPVVTAFIQSLSIAMLMSVGILSGQVFSHPPRPILTALFLFSIALIVLGQLLPLPTDFWATLPGREAGGNFLASAGRHSNWQSLSLDPYRSFETSLELLPGLALFLVGIKASPKLLRGLLLTTLAVGLASATIGALQLAGGPNSPVHFYEIARGQIAPGLFVNRNHQAALLLITIPIAALTPLLINWPHQTRRHARLIAWSLILVLAAGVIATTSRAGFGLLPIALVAAALINRDKAPGLKAALGVLGPLTIVIVALSQSATLQRLLDRFSAASDGRTTFWENTLTAAQQYWPIGSGVGTFEITYPSVEPLAQVTDSYVNNAHNEYVELWLELGIFAPIVGLIVLGLLAIAAYKCFHSPNVQQRSFALAAIAGWIILLLHSQVDYPLRMMSIMAIAGLLTAMLLCKFEPAKPGPPIHMRPAWRTGPILCLLLALTGLVWSFALAQRDVLAGKPEQALAYNPWSPRALTAGGQNALERGDTISAHGMAVRALRVSPLDPDAQALMIAVLNQSADAGQIDRLLKLAATRGWREPHLQYMLAERAADRDDFAISVQHTDALLRTGSYISVAQPFMRTLALTDEGNAALVKALALNPSWRASFLRNLRDLPEDALPWHVSLLNGLDTAQSPPTRADYLAYLNVLLTHGRVADAVEVAELLSIPTVTGRLIPFEPDLAPSPFDWKAGQGLGITTRFSDNGTVLIDAPLATVGTALSRLIASPNGDYHLTAQLKSSGSDLADILKWQIRCRATGKVLTPQHIRYDKTQADGYQMTVDFSVGDDQCELGELRAVIDSATGGSLQVELIELDATSGTEP